MGDNTLPQLDVQKLAHKLSVGFETLLKEVEDLANREATLRKQLEVAKKQHNQISPCGSSEESLNILNANEGVPAEAEINGGIPHSDQKVLVMANPAVREAMDACKVIKSKPDTKSDTTARRCPVSHKTTDPEDFEQDFTTPGVQGNLQCPFARMVENGVLPVLANGTADPIAAEFHLEQASIQSKSPPVQAPGKCPIRFLDQHSPEEVAKYFENHKHEIPRSHEVCVKRYQQNEQSIRQLDAKYGNLVNMIQGLGVKHKQYLPGDEQHEQLRKEQGSVEAVEKWADDVSHKSLEPIPEQVPADNDVLEEEGERKPHFARSLREIRVGESPSRPWGIFVPAAQEPSKSAMLSDPGSARADLPRSEASNPRSILQEPAKRCPVDHGVHHALPNGPGAQTAQKAAAPEAGKEPSSQPHIVFNGPVFFGYSAEQAAALLQSLNLGGRHP